eukprot:5167585-Heterocapsa_arctica.AAC.1
MAGLNGDLRELCTATIERSGAILGRLASLSRSIAGAHGGGTLLTLGAPAAARAPAAQSQGV